MCSRQTDTPPESGWGVVASAHLTKIRLVFSSMLATRLDIRHSLGLIFMSTWGVPLHTPSQVFPRHTVHTVRFFSVGKFGINPPWCVPGHPMVQELTSQVNLMSRDSTTIRHHVD